MRPVSNFLIMQLSNSRETIKRNVDTLLSVPNAEITKSHLEI